jgi:hypothetical protein
MIKTNGTSFIVCCRLKIRLATPTQNQTNRLQDIGFAYTVEAVQDYEIWDIGKVQVFEAAISLHEEFCDLGSVISGHQ